MDVNDSHTPARALHVDVVEAPRDDLNMLSNVEKVGNGLPYNDAATASTIIVGIVTPKTNRRQVQRCHEFYMLGIIVVRLLPTEDAVTTDKRIYIGDFNNGTRKAGTQ